MPSFTDTNSRQDWEFQNRTMNEVMDFIDDFVEGLRGGVVDGVKHESISLDDLMPRLKEERNFYGEFIDEHYIGAE